MNVAVGFCLKRLQVRDDVVFVFGTDGVAERRHGAAAIGDERFHVRLIHGLAVHQLLALEQTLQAGSDLGFGRVGVMARRAAFKRSFAFLRVGVGGG